jgi:hypothetical protein
MLRTRLGLGPNAGLLAFESGPAAEQVLIFGRPIGHASMELVMVLRLTAWNFHPSRSKQRSRGTPIGTLLPDGCSETNYARPGSHEVPQ